MRNDIVISGLTNIRIVPEDELTDYQPPEQDYWECDGIRDATFEEVLAEVEGYLAEMDADNVQPNISWAPLSDTRWELVGFHPDYGSAVLDSTYATPEVARRIMAFVPEVELMDLRRD